MNPGTKNWGWLVPEHMEPEGHYHPFLWKAEILLRCSIVPVTHFNSPFPDRSFHPSLEPFLIQFYQNHVYVFQYINLKLTMNFLLLSAPNLPFLMSSSASLCLLWDLFCLAKNVCLLLSEKPKIQRRKTKIIPDPTTSGIATAKICKVSEDDLNHCKAFLHLTMAVH